MKSLEERVKKLEEAQVKPVQETCQGQQRHTGVTTEAPVAGVAQMLRDEDAAFRKMLEERLAARANTSTGSGGETKEAGPRVVTVSRTVK